MGGASEELKEIGLVLQGGGALGAYEYGAIQALLENGYVPRVISGVSIGAINTAVLAGAKGPLPTAELDERGQPTDPDGHRQRYLAQLRDNMLGSIHAMWDLLTMPNNPFLPASQQAMLSIMGNPAFWSMRADWMNMTKWTNYYDVKPMYRTLGEVVDFDRINGADAPVRMAVTATCIETGGNTRFANFDPRDTVTETASVLYAEQPELAADEDPNLYAPLGTIKARTRIGPAHIMASGALPPSFPGVWIEGRTYWDGGLFDNTPIRPLVEMLTADQAKGLPIVVINLFPHMSPVPTDLLGVSNRMMAIQYQSRFADSAGSYEGLLHYGRALEQLLDISTKVEKHLQSDDASLMSDIKRLKADPQFQRLLLYRAFKNVIVVPALTDFTQIGPMDFSAYGIQTRRAAGHDAITTRLRENGQLLDRLERTIRGTAGTAKADRAAA